MLKRKKQIQPKSAVGFVNLTQNLRNYGITLHISEVKAKGRTQIENVTRQYYALQHLQLFK